MADGGASDKAGGGDITSVCTTSCGGIFTLTLIFGFSFEEVDILRGWLGSPV